MMTGMKFSEALGEVIREERQARGLSLRAVSLAGYVSMGHLSDVENGRKEGSSSFVSGVAIGLGVEAYELIVRAGYRMAEFQIPDSPESLFSSKLRGVAWQTQYADLKA